MKKRSIFIIFAIFLVLFLAAGCSGEEREAAGADDNEIDAAKRTDDVEKNQKEVSVDETAQEEDSDFKVTLIGTGSPLLGTNRFGMSTLVEAGEEKILIDAGRGSAVHLNKSGVMPGEIDKLFLTHLHSDHTVGIPDIWLTGLLKGMEGNRETEFQVWGPQGTKELMSGLEAGYEDDVENRVGGEFSMPEGARTKSHEIEEGVVYDENDIEIIAFTVEHDIAPAFGYRINYNGHSVVISGDTTYNENLIDNSKEADLIVHEVAAADPKEMKKEETFEHILSKHTTPEEAGKVFQRAQPKLAVYSHIVLLGSLKEEKADLVERTKKNYDGEVVVGEDLMSFHIGEEVTVKKTK